MAALTIFCPQCNTALKVPASAPEQIRCKCPQCGTTFQAAKPTPPVESSTPEPAERPVPKPKAGKVAAGSSRWLLVAVVVALVGLLPLCCIGIAAVGWIGLSE